MSCSDAGGRNAPYSAFVESAIARTLTGDIYRADDRAIASINRELFAADADRRENQIDPAASHAQHRGSAVPV